MRYFKVKEERAYLKIEALEAMENVNSSLSLADIRGMFKTGAANINGGKDQDACLSKLSEHALR